MKESDSGSNLLPNGKFIHWTISFVNEYDNMVMVEPVTKAEAIEELKELKENGQDMEWVNVYPPKSNLTYNELLNYKESI